MMDETLFSFFLNFYSVPHMTLKSSRKLLVETSQPLLSRQSKSATTLRRNESVTTQHSTATGQLGLR